MQKVTIVSDSMPDIPGALASELGIITAPLRLIVDETEYRDRIDITPEEFYDRLEEMSEPPTTTGVSAPDFVQAYQKSLEQAEQVLCIVIAEEFSVTYSNAHLAKREMPQANITIIDSRTAAAAQALIVLAAAELAREGATLDEVVDRVEQLIPQVNLLFTVDTLDYLRKGGRLSAPQHFIGKVLNVKPVLQIRDGVVAPVARERSREKAKKRILDMMAREVSGRQVCAAVLHALIPEETEVFRNEIADRFDCKKLYLLDDLGPVAGTHGGPGSLGVGYHPHIL